MQIKKCCLLLSLILTSFSAFAVPAKPGICKTIKLTDGSEVRVTLCGDEHNHFWKSEDGSAYTFDSSTQSYVKSNPLQLARRSAMRRAHAESARQVRRDVAARQKIYKGTKRGLVILAQFPDRKFADVHDPLLYNDILNAEDYKTGIFQGSVRDYFKAQSGGVFDLQFDIVGPFTVAHNYAYYGGNNSDGSDRAPAEMIIEACLAADSIVDFSKYDWSGDGEVDQVYVVYAGKGEADSYEENTIWPHEWNLYSAGYFGDGSGAQKLDGVWVNTYACGSEVDKNDQLEGIGTFCHEFSHCLGLPDTYDTQYQGYFGMGEFDIMCSGNYNGNGFVPAGYTAYEKWQAGWITPINLGNKDVAVDSLQPTSEGGDAYIIYNKAHTDEYYLVENRQQTHWDAGLPCAGLQVMHVDYNANLWQLNAVNTMVSYYVNNVPYQNDHERLTIFHADNDDDRKYWKVDRYTKTTTRTDLYPNGTNDSLTATSVPAAVLHNAGPDGQFLMQHALLGIKQNADGSVSFQFRSGAPYLADSISIEPDSVTVIKGDTAQLSAVALPEDADDGEYVWSVMDANVAQVMPDGKVLGLKSGKTYVFASLLSNSSIKDSCLVTVVQPVTSLTLSTSSKSLLVGESFNLIATVSPSDADNKNVVWKSESEDIATVDSGKVTALKAGTVKIFAVSEENPSISDYCEVTITQPVTGISLDYDIYELKGIGESVQLLATVFPEDATNKEVMWTSSDENVCLVSNGTVIAVGYGTAVIIATTSDGNYMAYCAVTVVDYTGIVDVADNFNYRVYNIQGQQLPRLQRGINVIRFNDGQVKKVQIK